MIPSACPLEVNLKSSTNSPNASMNFAGLCGQMLVPGLCCKYLSDTYKHVLFFNVRMIFTNFCPLHPLVVTSLLAQLEGHMEGNRRNGKAVQSGSSQYCHMCLARAAERKNKKEHRQTLRRGKNQIYK